MMYFLQNGEQMVRFNDDSFWTGFAVEIGGEGRLKNEIPIIIGCTAQNDHKQIQNSALYLREE